MFELENPNFKWPTLFSHSFISKYYTKILAHFNLFAPIKSRNCCSEFRKSWYVARARIYMYGILMTIFRFELFFEHFTPLIRVIQYLDSKFFHCVSLFFRRNLLLFVRIQRLFSKLFSLVITANVEHGTR